MVAISSRHSVRTAVRPRRVEAGEHSVVLGVAEHGLDGLFAYSVERLPGFCGQDGAHRTCNDRRSSPGGVPCATGVWPDQHRDVRARR